MPHRSHDELRQELMHAHASVTTGREYIHYKYPERRYRVIDIGIQEESEKVCVIYCDSRSPDIHFVRDLDSWLEKINNTPRFVLA